MRGVTSLLRGVTSLWRGVVSLWDLARLPATRASKAAFSAAVFAALAAFASFTSFAASSWLRSGDGDAPPLASIASSACCRSMR